MKCSVNRVRHDTRIDKQKHYVRNLYLVRFRYLIHRNFSFRLVSAKETRGYQGVEGNTFDMIYQKFDILTYRNFRYDRTPIDTYFMRTVYRYSIQLCSSPRLPVVLVVVTLPNYYGSTYTLLLKIGLWSVSFIK